MRSRLGAVIIVLMGLIVGCSGSAVSSVPAPTQTATPPPPATTSPTNGPDDLASKPSVPTEADGDTAATAIVDVRLFDGEQVIDRTTVVFQGNRIIEVGPDIEIPLGATVLDGVGKTLLPGLIDAHTHTTINDALVQAVAFGVTTHLDMFSEPNFLSAERRAEATNPDRPQADIFSAGILGTSPGGHGTQFGVDIATMSTPAEATAWVQAQAEANADFIKLVLEDGSQFAATLANLDTPTYSAAVTEAERLDLLIITHVSTLADATRAIENGSTGLAHLFVDQPATTGFVELIVERQGFVVPTLVVLSSVSDSPSGPSIVDDPDLGPRLTPFDRSNLGRAFPWLR